MPRVYPIIVLLAGCAACANAAPNESDSSQSEKLIDLPDITVVGHPPSDPVKEVSGVTALDRAALSMSEERDLNGVLRGLPGLTLHRLGGGTAMSSVFVRGISSGRGSSPSTISRCIAWLQGASISLPC
jgi:outer membrane cobalamin receptor